MCDPRGFEHRRAWALWAPQIAFEESKPRRPDQLGIERARRQLMARAGTSAHRSLRVWSNEDQAASGRRRTVDRRRLEPHSERTHVVREDCAKLVVGDLADEGGVEAERCSPGHAVRSRAAADLARWPHRRIKIARFLGRKQPHRAFGKSALLQKGVVAGRDDVDDRIADRHDIEAVGIHGSAG